MGKAWLCLGLCSLTWAVGGVASAAPTLLDNFDSYISGQPLNGQGGWVSNPAGTNGANANTVTVEPQSGTDLAAQLGDVPAIFANYKPLGALSIPNTAG